MRSKLKKSNGEGFTIIEVMIVLVIAGLILLIVFLAVPALQRSARNTSRKSDASALASSMTEYLNNNNGVLPTAITNAAGAVQFTGLAATNAKMGYYTTGVGQGNADVYLTNQAGLGTYTGGGSKDYVAVVTGATCGVGAAQGTATPTYTTVAASAHAFAVLYEIETGSNTYEAVCTAD
jgi:prepilin-type N-terminal cleavage/methylation domain-containing protein